MRQFLRFPGRSSRPCRRPSNPSRRPRRAGLLFGIVLVANVIALAFGSDQIAGRDAEVTPGTADRAGLEFFESRVRPLLVDSCYECHGAQKQKGGLRLNSRASVLTGGDSGPAISPGEPGESLLLRAVRYTDTTLQMPPSGKLSDRKIATLERWVALGAPWPIASPESRAGDGAITPVRDHGVVSEEDRNFWSFRPIVRPTVPTSPSHVSQPIDRLVTAQLKASGLSLSPRASDRDLVRRVYFDLIGLPPPPEEIDAFAASDGHAYEKLVDRLLASPRYGERWGRHWLDVVRFAQTDGYERDGEKKQSWRYRDYVISAFNGDKPYDDFILQQLAGDELDEVSHESIIATGFYRLGVWDDEPDDKLVGFLEEKDDILRTLGETFLGLTIGCARCHDHKFDPVPQQDYYRLLAFIDHVTPYGEDRSATHWRANEKGIFTPLLKPGELRVWQQAKHGYETALAASRSEREALIEATRAKLRQQLAAELPEAEREALARPEDQRSDLEKRVAAAAAARVTPSDEAVLETLKDHPKLRELDERIAKLEEAMRSEPFEFALSVRESGELSRQTRVLVRGNPRNPGAAVAPQFLTVLGGHAPKLRSLKPRGQLADELIAYGVERTSGRRRALAEWIANARNPLTARVMMNRLWHHHFGRGLVSTPNDFGKNGRQPSHPKLLDWLAAEFIASGWSTKHMHRTILRSDTYQQSSRALDERAARVDPENRLLWRQNLRRLEAEAIRDAALHVSGELNLAMGGRGIFPTLPAAVLATQSRPGSGWGKSTPNEEARRSIYIFVKRTLGVPFLESFDFPKPDTSDPARPTTTIAPQALTMLNGLFIDSRTKAFAARLVAENAADSEQLITTDVERVIERGFRLALGRSPTPRESETVVSHLKRQGQTTTPRAASESVARLLFNLSEFVYVD